ncbi:MAG: CoB--CoM heterodisulfide reductase iron-sulfur subunit A family protein [Thermodesulfobacteriota bacterium]|nr:CoB--CoM heterodisulfide reductase iron-sulfur subunit A family protein [Thermodesulfobacteriota bacterium]
MTHSNDNKVIGAVMVIGGGIAGIQAALDLANSGFFVYLVDSASAIGGRMGQLDKTFPTNDCSMCMLAPKLNECDRHPNIQILASTTVQGLEGEAGHFVATVSQRPRYVDPHQCTCCGTCSAYCPVVIEDGYNEGLSTTKALHIDYPQAIPAAYHVDPSACLFLTRQECKQCERVCKAQAIDFDQREVVLALEVGAVVLATGFEPFDPRIKGTYGYGQFPNVVTSMEFERILSATGPFQGHVRRPSDGKEPKKIAWIQCVGSRDPSVGKGYCSSVCCMYAIKEAMLAKEHAAHDLDTAVFYMDIRSHGKDFETFYDRARQEIGIRFVRSRIDTVTQDGQTEDLFVQYTDESSKRVREAFDLVVLSVGLGTSRDVQGLAATLGIPLDRYHFGATTSFTPVLTARPGVYLCGAFQGPKDIPQSVMEASAAAGAISAALSGARHSLTKVSSYPKEKDVAAEAPRIGVFVCHCGINIGGVVRVPEVAEYAKTLPNVVWTSDELFACSADVQEKIKGAIDAHGLNRVVVASCSPRTHEPLFRETLREAGLNKYLFEMANIRDQCSWVHAHDPEQATEKAKDLVRMAAARASLMRPLAEPQVPVTKSCLVVGGGVAGMTSAWNLAEQGYEAHVVERNDRLGGQARSLYRTWKGEEVRPYLEKLVRAIEEHPSVHVHLQSTVKAASGFVGNFISHVVDHQGNEEEVLHGATILASGGQAYAPEEYLYKEDPNVYLALELDREISKNPNKFRDMKSAVFIQCVGSREPARPYCSKVCCTHSIESALRLKECNPDMAVHILYRDVRTYGLREDLYTEARSKGIVFLRYDLAEKPTVARHKGKLKVSVKDQALGCYVETEADIVTLASAIIPCRDNGALSRLYKVSMNQEGFFLEAHVKLRPVDVATDGVFLAGLSHYPKPIEETIAQAQAAAARAGALLSQDAIVTEGVVATVNEDACRGCGLCVALCPFEALQIVDTPKGRKVQPVDVACKGCGVCAATCYRHAISIKGFTDGQLQSQVKALLK